MSFKDEVQNDLSAVFLELEEFAEVHSIEYQDVICILDTVQSTEKANEYDIAQADLIVMAKAEDMPPRKEAGALLNIDSKEYTVIKWDVQDGLTVVELSNLVNA